MIEFKVYERLVHYNKHLNPVIWKDGKIIERIRLKLLEIAMDFYNELEFEDVELLDVQMTGSNANFNYSSKSDIDVHLIIDFENVAKNTKIVRKMMNTLRNNWSFIHDITIGGHEVELYIQDVNEQHEASGLYSLMYNEWIKKPEYNRPNVDQKDVDLKYESFASAVDEFEKILDMDEIKDSEEWKKFYKAVNEFIKKMLEYRKEGLHEKEGEFSIENLVYKKFRNEGKLQQLIDLKNKFYDKIYVQ